jgi:hypothetical protein
VTREVVGLCAFSCAAVDWSLCPACVFAVPIPNNNPTLIKLPKSLHNFLFFKFISKQDTNNKNKLLYLNMQKPDF